MERGGGGNEQEVRVPLSEVVADCVRRWFNEALKEARAGDTAMQVLVGQMYHSGYGVPKNDQKVSYLIPLNCLLIDFVDSILNLVISLMNYWMAELDLVSRGCL